MEEVRKIVNRIEQLNKQLKALELDKKNEEIKISYFNHTGWDKIEFNIQKGKPVYNMIIHQVRLDLQLQIKEAKALLKKKVKVL